MRSEEKIRSLLAQAQQQTSAQRARINLIVPGDGNWIILIQSGAEELAIEVADSADLSEEQLLADLKDQLKRLF